MHLLKKNILLLLFIVIGNTIYSQHFTFKNNKLDLKDSLADIIINEVKKFDTIKGKELIAYYIDNDSTVYNKKNYIFGIFVIKFRVKLFHTIIVRVPIFIDRSKKLVEYNVNNFKKKFALSNKKLFNRFKMGSILSLSIVYIDRIKAQ